MTLHTVGMRVAFSTAIRWPKACPVVACVALLLAACDTGAEPVATAPDEVPEQDVARSTPAGLLDDRPLLPELSPREAMALHGAGGIRLVDANPDTARRSMGVIAGALLLEKGFHEAPGMQLPAGRDAPLVFYCAGVCCPVADTAANSARRAGYRNVRVLRKGIMGWQEAGGPVAALGASETTD